MARVGGFNVATFNSVPFNAAPIGGAALHKNTTFSDGATFDDGSSFRSYGPSARTILSGEFTEVLAEEVLDQLSGELGDGWLPLTTVDAPRDDTGLPASVTGTVADQILERLANLEGALGALAPTHGGIGHNVPSDEAPLTIEEATEARASIRDAESAIASGPTREGLRPLQICLQGLSKNVGGWVSSKASLFIDETVKSAGAETGKMIVGLPRAVSVLWLLHELTVLVDRLIHSLP